MWQRLRLRVLAWLVARRPTRCDECDAELTPGRAVDREWCSVECARIGVERRAY